MDAAQRELNGQIDQATQRLLDDARIAREADLRAPSLLPGWTRAHVLAYVARSADAMRYLLVGARSGQDRVAGTDASTREADLERGAAMSPKDLTVDLADSAMALRTIIKQLPKEAWQVRVQVPDSAPFAAAGLLIRRLVEVELRHCDLGVGYSSADWPPAFATMELAEPMRSQREDRFRYPPPSPGTQLRLAARPVARWKPGQRLPGSWLGTGNDRRALPAPPDGWLAVARGGWAIRAGFSAGGCAGSSGRGFPDRPGPPSGPARGARPTPAAIPVACAAAARPASWSGPERRPRTGCRPPRSTGTRRPAGGRGRRPRRRASTR